MGKTNKKLAISRKGAILLEGKRFGNGTSEADLKAWEAKY